MQTLDTNSWAEFKNLIHERFLGNNWIYRGQAEAVWDLQSGLERLKASSPQKVESTLISEFKKKCHLYDPNPQPVDTLDFLSLMQHHGAPTRLLDFSRSAYFAAFFAFEGLERFKNYSESERVAVWIVDANWLKRETLRNLFEDDAFRALFEIDNPESFRDIELSDRKFFDSIFVRGQFSCQLVYPINPQILHGRISLQGGLFICPNSVSLPLMEQLLRYSEAHLYLFKITIPKRERNVALHELCTHMGASRERLFGGMDGFAQSLVNSCNFET